MDLRKEPYVYTENGQISVAKEEDGSLGIVVCTYDPDKDKKVHLDRAYDIYSRTLKKNCPRYLRKR